MDNKKGKANKNKEQEKKYNEKVNIELSEDTTKYGEWISSYFTWITPREQKEKAEELNDMTKKKEENK